MYSVNSRAYAGFDLVYSIQGQCMKLRSFWHFFVERKAKSVNILDPERIYQIWLVEAAMQYLKGFKSAKIQIIYDKKQVKLKLF